MHVATLIARACSGRGRRRRRPLAAAAALVLCCGCAPQLSDQDHLAKAREYRDKGEYRAAIIELKNSLQKNPQNRDARLDLGSLYLSLGNGSAAEKELRRAVELGVPEQQTRTALARALVQQRKFSDVVAMCEAPGPDDALERAGGLVACAEAWVGSGKPDRARGALQRAIDLDRASLEVLQGAVRISLALNDMAAGQEWVRRALELDAEDPESWHLFGDIAFADARHEEAARAYEKVIAFEQRAMVTSRSVRARIGLVFSLLSMDREEEALPHIEVLLKANPKYFLFNYLRGLAAFKRADYASALEFLQRAIDEAKPESPAYAMLGAVHYALGNLEQADLYLGKYFKAVPDDVRARKLLGAVRLKLGQPDRATEALTLSAPSARDDTELLRMLGAAAAMMGDFGEGREYFRRALVLAPENDALRAQIAQLHFAEGDYERGLKELESAGKNSGAAQQARIMAIAGKLREKDRDGALQSARELVKEQPKQPAAHNILGGVYLVLKDNTRAREEFQRALALDGRFVDALMNLATLEQNERNGKLAREYLDRVLKIDAKHVEAMVKMAQLEEQDGRQAAAIDWLERARGANRSALMPRLLLARFRLRLGQAEQAETLGLEALAAAPGNVVATLLLGDAQMARKAFDRAQVTFESFTRTHPKDPMGYVRLASVLSQRGQLDSARQNLRRALDLQPALFAAVAALAALEMRAERPKDALRVADDYLRRRPGTVDGLTLRGDVLAAQGQFETAEQTYARAAQVQPTGTLVAKRARVLLAIPRAERALTLLGDWLAKNPQDELNAQIQADALRRLNRPAEAAVVYERLLKTRPDDVGILNNLALVYLDTSDRRARETAERAYALLPGHPLVIDTYGWVLLRGGDRSKGLSLLAQAAERAPGNPDVQTHFAIAQEADGQRDRARATIERVLSTDRVFESRGLAEELRRKLAVSGAPSVAQ
jgi:putative PEP-CTERM system TPR-repeat lipoprotein